MLFNRIVPLCMFLRCAFVVIVRVATIKRGIIIYFLAINAGSSSIKFSLFRQENLEKIAEGALQGIGFESANFVVSSREFGDFSRDLVASDHKAAMETCLDWMTQKVSNNQIAAIGHRIVHGGPHYAQSQIITNEILAGLRDIVPFDREHLPAGISLVEELQHTFPDIPHVACFDTAFHRDLPTEARLLPIPRRYLAKGLRRYGFHGLSYAYLLQEFSRVAGEGAANGRVIIAHMGNGVSLSAIRDGRSIDTTMGLSPSGGVPMSTRSGDLDPSVAAYLDLNEGVSSEQFSAMTSLESGLIGLSETTSDMKKLLEIEADDTRAAEAIALFCYQIKKQIGAYAAALGGVDSLIFSGGMGEQAPRIRARICEGLEFVGIELDNGRNEMNSELISSDASKVGVHVLHTDEAVTIVTEMSRLVRVE